MKLILNFLFKTSAFLIVLLSSSHAYTQEHTQGILTFTIQTSTYGGDYSPKHVLSIWIEDANGFVKTNKLRGDRRKKYLYTWNSKSAGNIVDAVTGSTLSSHQSHTVTWDGSDINRNIVPDGDYKIRVEFAEEHAQGPLYSLTFNKGKDIMELSPSDEGKFKNISLLWEPAIIAAPEAVFSYAIEDLTVTFTNSSTNAEAYNWDFGDSLISSEPNPVHTYAEAGTYKVILEAMAGELTATTEQDVTVTSNISITAPEALFSYTSEDLTVTFTNSSTNAEAYNWDFGDSLNSSESNPVHTYAEAGTYKVILEAMAGELTATAEQDITVTENTLEVEGTAFSMKVYPIPADRQLIVDFGQISAMTGYEILSIDGRLLKDAPLSEKNRVVIPLNDLQKGSYILRLKGVEKEFVYHFLKQ